MKFRDDYHNTQMATTKTLIERLPRPARWSVMALLMVVSVTLGSLAASGQVHAAVNQPNICMLDNPDRPCIDTPDHMAWLVRTDRQAASPHTYTYPLVTRHYIVRAHDAWARAHMLQYQAASVAVAEPALMGAAWWDAWRAHDHYCLWAYRAPLACSAGTDGYPEHRYDVAVMKVWKVTMVCGGWGAILYLSGTATLAAAGWNVSGCGWGGFWAMF